MFEVYPRNMVQRTDDLASFERSSGSEIARKYTIFFRIDWFVDQTPANHLINEFDGVGEICGLQTEVLELGEQRGVIDALVKVIALNCRGGDFFWDDLVKLLLLLFDNRLH